MLVEFICILRFVFSSNCFLEIVGTATLIQGLQNDSIQELSVKVMPMVFVIPYFNLFLNNAHIFLMVDIDYLVMSPRWGFVVMAARQVKRPSKLTQEKPENSREKAQKKRQFRRWSKLTQYGNSILLSDDGAKILLIFYICK